MKVSGGAVTPQSIAVLPDGSNAILEKGLPLSNKYDFAFFSLSLKLTPIIWIPCPESSNNLGCSARQGGHQLAQKLTNLIFGLVISEG